MGTAMRRYLLSFLGAYLGSILAFVGMLFVALSQWMFSETPLWFNILCVAAVILPVLALGQLAGRHPGKNPPTKLWIGLMILLGIMGVLACAGAFSEPLRMLSWPGLLIGEAVGELLRVKGYWDGAMPLLGNLMVPVVFHLGWCWGREK